MNNQNQEPASQEPKKVEVSAEDLNALLAKVDRLESAVSKKKLADYDTQHDPNEERVSVRYMLEEDGTKKVVTSWSNRLKNKCQKNIHGGWEEEQTIEIHCGKEKQVLTHVQENEFLKATPKLLVVGKRESNELNPHGNKSLYYTVEFEGKKHEIESVFVNP